MWQVFNAEISGNATPMMLMEMLNKNIWRNYLSFSKSKVML